MKTHRKNLGEWNNLTEAPGVASVQYCKHDVEYGSPSKTMEMIYGKTEKKSDFCFVCFF